MGNPKRRHSRSRGRKRRTHWKLDAPTLTSCPQCHEPVRPHHVCLNCGHYAGRSAVEVE